MAKLILSGYLPAGEHQGVTALYDEIVGRFDARQSAEEYLVVCRMRAHTANVVLDGDEPPPITMRILAAEVVHGVDAEQASVMLRAARDKRLGPTMIAADGGLEPDAVPDASRPVENVALPPGGGEPAFTDAAVESVAESDVVPLAAPKGGRGRAKR